MTVDDVMADDMTVDDVTADDVTANDVTADDVTADDVTADDVTADGQMVRRQTENPSLNHARVGVLDHCGVATTNRHSRQQRRSTHFCLTIYKILFDM